MSTTIYVFEQKYEKYQNFYLKNFHFLVVKCSVYLNRRVFIMYRDFRASRLSTWFSTMLYNRVFNCFKQHVYYVSINSFIYNVSKNNFLECSTCLQ